jgi:enamine deaminase RidA (YjgF/YER057c/UK114 family)
VPALIERLGTSGFVRAGKWIFGTGLRARDAQALFQRMDQELRAAGSSLSRVARLDQYYPDAGCVPPYHLARKQAFGAGHIAPSTSVIVSGLLGRDAQMDVQVIAATDASGYAPEPVQAGLNRPDASGYTPCVRVGELIFVAGQLARDASGRLAVQGPGPETDYMVRERLVPALKAAQSGLDLVLKAQVYLSRPQDLPAFRQAWTRAFAGRVPPTTVVALRHPAFLTSEATVEINLLAAHGSARARIRKLDCEVEARVLDGLLFVAGLEGERMDEIMERARRIFAAAGSDLSNVVRALVFHSDLDELRDPGMPFTAVKVHAGLTLDLWGYAPPS